MRLQKNIILLTWFNFFVGLKLYAPLAILYFHQVTGSFALGMAVFSVVQVSAALFEVPTGVLSDRLGRVKTMLYGAVASSSAVILYALAGTEALVTDATVAVGVLFSGAIAEGMSRSLWSGNNEAFLHDTLKQHKQQEEYAEFSGKTNAAVQVSLAIAAIVGSVLADWSFTWVMWLSVFPQLICVILALQMQEPKVHAQKDQTNVFAHLGTSFSHFRKSRKLQLLSISSILYRGFGESAFQFQAAFYATVWPVWALGIPKMLTYIGSYISFRYSGAVLQRFGMLPSLIGGSLFERSIGLIAAIFPSVYSPLLISVTSLPFGVQYVAKDTFLQREFTDRQRSTMGSLNAFAGSLLYAVTSFGLGFIADLLSPTQGFIIIQLMLVPVIGLYLLLARIDKKKPV